MSKTCKTCGRVFADEVENCVFCNTPLNYCTEEEQTPEYAYSVNTEAEQTDNSDASQTEQAVYKEREQREQNSAPATYARTKKEFLNLPQNNGIRKGINFAAIACYIACGLTLLIAAFSNSAAVLVDAGILLGMGLGIQLGKSMACAIVLLVYGIIDMIITIIVLHTFGGILIVAAGIVGTVNTKKLRDEWETYRLYRNKYWN